MAVKRTTARFPAPLGKRLKRVSGDSERAQQEIITESVEFTLDAWDGKVQVSCPSCRTVSTLVKQGPYSGLVPIPEQKQKKLDNAFVYIPSSIEEAAVLRSAINLLIEASARLSRRDRILYRDVLALVTLLLTPTDERERELK